jgi:hypothetical protein
MKGKSDEGGWSFSEDPKDELPPPVMMATAAPKSNSLQAWHLCISLARNHSGGKFHRAISGLQALNGEVKSVRRCVVNFRKIAVVAVLCAVTALVACRREEVVPLKLGGPVAEQPAR